MSNDIRLGGADNIGTLNSVYYTYSATTQASCVICMNLQKLMQLIDVTADTLVGAGNIKPPIAPLDSALKIGLHSVLWCCLVVHSTRLATSYSTTIIYYWCHVVGSVGCWR